MQNYLLIIWISTLGLDRIDFSRGIGNFTLTPFLILSPLIIFLFVFSHIIKPESQTLKVTKGIGLYFLIVNIFLAIILISTIFATDNDISIKRSILLILQIYFTAIIFLIINNQKKQTVIKVFLYGCYLGVIFSACSDILQIMSWLHISSFDFNGIINIAPPSYGSYAPRLAGVSVDMNRGGILLCFYLFFIIKLGNSQVLKKIFISIAIFLILITFSRSSIGSLLVMLSMIWLKSTSKLFDLRKFLLYSLFVSSIITLVYFLVGKGIDFNVLLNERLSFSNDSSGGIHLSLISDALQIWTSSIKNTFFGVGFANSFLYLFNVSGNNVYGNFHSIFVSILVENGLFGLVIFMILLLYPLLRKNYYLALTGALLVFNLFYQLTLEPMFWFAIVLSWANMRLNINSVDWY